MSPSVRAAVDTCELQLHGLPQLRSAPGQTLLLEGRTAAVVAFVAFESGARRDHLAALLWPDSEDPRRNLRQLLLRLMRQLGQTALITGDAVLRLAGGERRFAGTHQRRTRRVAGCVSLRQRPRVPGLA